MRFVKQTASLLVPAGLALGIWLIRQRGSNHCAVARAPCTVQPAHPYITFGIAVVVVSLIAGVLVAAVALRSRVTDDDRTLADH